MQFFVGLHQPSDAHRFGRAFVSVNRLRSRKKPLGGCDWIMDSGAFTTIARHGGYPDSVEDYAAQIRRWRAIEGDRMLAAVAQDFMCEPMMLARTGLTVADHQRLTIERYDALAASELSGCYPMPVLQGYAPKEYVAHIARYGSRLAKGAWVGVGSVCKRNGDAHAIERVLWEIQGARSDLRLHGFGLKKTALDSPLVCALLYSADSMAWSYAARRQGRDPNCWLEATRYVEAIGDGHPQKVMFV